MLHHALFSFFHAPTATASATACCKCLRCTHPSVSCPVRTALAESALYKWQNFRKRKPKQPAWVLTAEIAKLNVTSGSWLPNTRCDPLYSARLHKVYYFVLVHLVLYCCLFKLLMLHSKRGFVESWRVLFISCHMSQLHSSLCSQVLGRFLSLFVLHGTIYFKCLCNFFQTRHCK